MLEKMPKSLYEFMKIVEAYQKNEKRIKQIKNLVGKNECLEMQQQMVEMMKKILFLTRIQILNPLRFLQFLKTYFYFDGNLHNFTNDEIKEYYEIIQKFTQFDRQEEIEKRDYYEQVACNPLFKEILGTLDVEEKKELEMRLEQELVLTKPYPDIYNFTRIVNDWQRKLDALKENGSIHEVEYQKYVLEINYVADYYSSIIMGHQQTLERKKVKN